MKNIEANSKKIILLLSLSGSIIFLLGLILGGNSSQKYADIIYDYTSLMASNKSIEMNLLYGVLFLGLFIYVVFFYFNFRKSQNYLDANEKNAVISKNSFISVLFVTTLLVTSVVFGKIYITLVGVFFSILLGVIFCKEALYLCVCTYYLALYACIALYRIYVFGGGTKSIPLFLYVMVAIALVFLFAINKNNTKLFIKSAAIFNIFIPFLVIIFLEKKYNYHGKLVLVDIPVLLKCFIVLLIGLFIIEALYKIKKFWNHDSSMDQFVSIGSCIAIMAMNRYDGTGAIMLTDLHHPFENIIGFSQIFELGQKPFEAYIPISGMYSILEGAIFYLFGNKGSFGNYQVVNNFFYLCLIILVALLLNKHLNGIYALFISIILYIPSYNRLSFILPIMLILMLPKLIENINEWLLVWVLTSLFHGLYYPLYGVATCVAFMPLGIWQLVQFIKTKEYKRKMKSVLFWMEWIGCLFLCIVCIPYLKGTLIHMLAMSNQSLLADGMARFGQKVPAWFLPYFGSRFLIVRLALYDILTFLLPVLLVWCGFLLSMLHHFDMNRNQVNDITIRKICKSLAFVIMPMICYSYTFIRLDVDSLFARSAGVIYACVILLFIVFINDIKQQRNFMWLLIILIVIMNADISISHIYQLDTDSRLSAYYDVPNDYVYVQDDNIRKLGTGFVEENMYQHIHKTKERFLVLDENRSYMGTPTFFGSFYLGEIRGAGPLELASTVKSDKAAKETLTFALKNDSILAPSFSPYCNYHLYQWLVTSGVYCWDANHWYFIHDNDFDKNAVLQINRDIEVAPNNENIGRTAGAWGESMQTLITKFDAIAIDMNANEAQSVCIDFKESLNGEDADFLYLELDIPDEDIEYTLYDLDGEEIQTSPGIAKYLMEKREHFHEHITVSWYDEFQNPYSMTCSMENGKLLIPLGAGKKWLLHAHDKIEIAAYHNGELIPFPKTKTIQWLKLKELNDIQSVQ